MPDYPEKLLLAAPRGYCAGVDRAVQTVERALELYGAQYPGGKIFNSAAFSEPPVGQQGNFGRNVLRGFGASQADVGLQRQFHITEKVGLRFRPEFFNIFNHSNLTTQLRQSR